jgi:TolB-like protein/Flp pilus assembly protein TadD
MLNSFFSELNRRNIFRVAGVYAVVGWLIIQLGIALETSLNLPGWFDTLLTTLVLICFPVAMVFAWAFEMTPEGVKRTESVQEDGRITDRTARKLDYVIVAGLVLVCVLIIGQTFINRSQTVSPGVASSDAREQSIAVLPFVDFSANKDQEYFANGISEELLNVLAEVKGLRVSSRTSSFTFKDQNTPISEIGETLNVAHVLEGSIRKSGDTLRITAQLIDTKTDIHMWSDTYDRPLTADNLFAVQDEIAESIVKELKGQLKFEGEDVPEDRTASFEAYELYLRAREHMRERLPDTLFKAEAGFKQVITLDPNFAPAYAGLADTYLLQDIYSNLDDAEAIKLARPYVEKALALSPRSSEVLSSAALLASAESNLEVAVAYAEKAIEANPNNSDAYIRLARAYHSLGQNEDALRAVKAGLDVDPLSTVLLSNAAINQIALGLYEEARETAEKNIRLNPDSTFGYTELATLMQEDGDYADAHAALKSAQALNPDSDFVLLDLAWLYAGLGMNEEAINTARSPWLKAILLAIDGQYETAMQVLPEDASAFDKVTVQYHTRDFPSTLASTKEINKIVGQIASDQVTQDVVHFYASDAFIYKSANDPLAADHIIGLDTYFAGKIPEDFKKTNDILAGATYAVIKGEPEKAYVWIERLIELGKASVVLADPIFDATRDTALHRQTEAKMEALLVPHRKAVKAQLANPKPNWVTNQ